MKIGFHTDAFNSAYFSFPRCLEWARQNEVHYIECGLIDGVSWIHGLGTSRMWPCTKIRCCLAARWRISESDSRRWMLPIRFPGRMDWCGACPTSSMQSAGQPRQESPAWIPPTDFMLPKISIWKKPWA